MEGKPTLPIAVDIRNLILNELTEPVLFRGLINDWSILSWTLCDWANKIGNVPLPFRAGLHRSEADIKEPLWEGKCPKVLITMKRFIEIVNCPSYERSQWLYFAYKHMNEWFPDKHDILEAVNWENFGFPERTGADSTLWIGSQGAHTPCHYDSYGCNLVAQVYGRKQWVLIPPQETPSMLPTRIPYEESSVFSSWNFNCLDSAMLSGDILKNALVITLNPGDVLFVPHHWWHYVESLETAISINTWIPLPQDDECRLDESLVRLIVAQFSRNLPSTQDLFNPDDIDLLDYPLSSLTELVEESYERCQEYKEENEHPLVKKIKLDSYHSLKPTDDRCSLQTSSSHQKSLDLLKKYEDFVFTLSKCSPADLLDIHMRNQHTSCDNNPGPSNREYNVETDVNYPQQTKAKMGENVTITVNRVLNAFCQPDVIELVKKKLKL